MSLVINLDVQKVNIQGIDFEMKPLNTAAMEKFMSLSQAAGLDDESKANQMLSNPEFKEFFSEIIPVHYTLLSEVEIQEGGETRQATLTDLLTIDSGQLLTIRTMLAATLINTASLKKDELTAAKK